MDGQIKKSIRCLNEPVLGPRVHVAVRIGVGDDVKVKLLRHGGFRGIQEPVNGVEAKCWGDPFSCVNPTVDEDGCTFLAKK